MVDRLAQHASRVRCVAHAARTIGWRGANLAARTASTARPAAICPTLVAVLGTIGASACTNARRRALGSNIKPSNCRHGRVNEDEGTLRIECDAGEACRCGHLRQLCQPPRLAVDSVNRSGGVRSNVDGSGREGETRWPRQSASNLVGETMPDLIRKRGLRRRVYRESRFRVL